MITWIKKIFGRKTTYRLMRLRSGQIVALEVTL